MLVVHHLNYSQSERIVWLCEELGLEYKLVHHFREPSTQLSPESLKSLPGNTLGNAPFIQDGDITLAESGAIVDYINYKYGGGRLALAPSHPHYADYLYWFHFSNASFQGLSMVKIMVKMIQPPPDNPVPEMLDMRLDAMLRMVNTRLTSVPYLAGSELSAADIMIIWTLTTSRYFYAYSLHGYPAILSYLKRISQRPAYRVAMEKGDKEMELMLGENPPAPEKMRL